MKKIFNIFLALMLVATLSPMNVLATEDVEEPETQEEQQKKEQEQKEKEQKEKEEKEKQEQEQQEVVPVDDEAQGEISINNDQSMNEKEIIKTPMETPASVTGEKYNGSGTVVDFTTTGSKSFYTVNTPDNSTYYIVIDLDKTENNVYFLSEVNGEELSMDQASQSQTAQQPQEVEPEPEPEQTQVESAQVEPAQDTNWTLWIVLLGAVALFGYQFFYGKLKNLNPLLKNKKGKNKDKNEDKENDFEGQDDNIYLEEEGYFLTEEEEEEDQNDN